MIKDFLSKLNWRRLLTSSFLVFVILTQLQYVFFHTSSLLIRLTAHSIVAYIAAFGIEVIIIVISFDIGARQGKEVSTWALKGILIFTLIGSAFANLVEGFLIRTGNDLISFADMTNLGWIQGLVSLWFTAGIPLLVYALSDTLGLYAVKEVESVQKAIKKQERTEEAKDKIIGKPEQERQAEIFEAFQQSSNGTSPLNKDLAAAHEVSVIKIATDIKALVKAGRLVKRVGKRGYKVTQNEEI